LVRGVGAQRSPHQLPVEPRPCCKQHSSMH
jgi:hypothetical protein